jgi:hydrogenase maturation protease
MIEKLQESNKIDKGGEKSSPPKIIILGVGNLLLSDEGVGVHIANELMKIKLPEGVSVFEGGTDGFLLLNIITGADRLIVIDALKGDAKPGSIYRFDIEEFKNPQSLFRTSIHQIGIMDVLEILKLIGKTPKTTIIGIEPKSLEIGMELSEEVKIKIPRIIELVLEELKREI